ncbi:MAG: glycolate oxidase subunit GlcF [Pseudomonadota bacterium]
MQTNLADFIKKTPEGEEADAILRNCVHCGFCTATCPTYQLLGDELDGPRGRIYLIKQVLEGKMAGPRTQLHLDRCLTCRSCETTCPSGVRYGRLLDIGREVVEKQVSRPPYQRVYRRLLRFGLSDAGRAALVLGIARWLRPMLPRAMRRKILPARAVPVWPEPRHERIMLALDGCVQSALAPGINASAARVLDRCGISLVRVPETGCCGALSYHLAAQDEGLDFMRRNIDTWWPHIENGAEAIAITASGCGVMVKEYGDLLRHDSVYAAKARRVSEIAKDIGEILVKEHLPGLGGAVKKRVAFHSPCTLQHGMKLGGVVEGLLRRLGFELTPVADAHLCCGSAGVYSLLQRELSQRLLDNKIQALGAGGAELAVTANIGCLAHLQSSGKLHVMHWVELVDQKSI